MIRFSAAEIFQKGMVFQREKPIVVFGRAERGDRVRVSLYDRHGGLLDERNCSAEKDDTYTVSLASMPAYRDAKLVIVNESSQQTIVINPVHIGEVWIACGQSNMEFFNKYDKDWERTKKLTANPDIHFYNVPQRAFAGHETHNGPGRDGYGKWLKDKEKGYENFSAPGYSFARAIQAKLKVPVGIIGCNWGGTTASAWVPESVLSVQPLHRYIEEYDAAVASMDSETLKKQSLEAWAAIDDPAGYKRFEPFLYGQDRKAQLKFVTDTKDDLVVPMGPYNENRPSGLYETMLSTIIPYSIRGALWYQGESDSGDRADMYGELLSGLIKSWRKEWNDDFPFLLVQLAPFKEWLACTNDDYRVVREKQQQVADAMEGVYMTSIMDIGNYYDIHPKEKMEVGKRLAGLALSHVYKSLQPEETDNPRIDKAYISGHQIILTFNNAQSLTKQSDDNTIFALHNKKKVVPDSVAISENKVVLEFNTDIDKSDDLRIAMGWEDYGALYIKNEHGLPIAPFCVEVV